MTCKQWLDLNRQILKLIAIVQPPPATYFDENRSSGLSRLSRVGEDEGRLVGGVRAHHVRQAERASDKSKLLTIVHILKFLFDNLLFLFFNIKSS